LLPKSLKTREECKRLFIKFKTCTDLEPIKTLMEITPNEAENIDEPVNVDLNDHDLQTLSVKKNVIDTMKKGTPVGNRILNIIEILPSSTKYHDNAAIS
jgi:hypothetical protein